MEKYFIYKESEIRKAGMLLDSLEVRGKGNMAVVMAVFNILENPVNANESTRRSDDDGKPKDGKGLDSGLDPG